MKIRIIVAAALALSACGGQVVDTPVSSTPPAPTETPTTAEAPAPTTTTTTTEAPVFFGREPSVDWYEAGRADILADQSFWDESEGWMSFICAVMIGMRTAEGRDALEAISDDEPEVWESTEEEPNTMAEVYESYDDVPDDVLDAVFSGASDVVCEAAGEEGS